MIAQNGYLYAVNLPGIGRAAAGLPSLLCITLFELDGGLCVRRGRGRYGVQYIHTPYAPQMSADPCPKYIRSLSGRNRSMHAFQYVHREHRCTAM